MKKSHFQPELGFTGPSDQLTNPNSFTYTTKSLLRYPGGKSRAVEFIISLIPKNINKVLSPFFGGGSIELALAARGTYVYGYDVFTPLVEFWQCALANQDELSKEVEKHFPLSKEQFYRLQVEQTKFKTKLERGAVFYVLNRSSFSGSTLSGGMSLGHPRFTQTSIERIKDFHNPNVEVNEADFQASLQKHPDTFAYLDPPYWIKNTLYGKKGNTHKGFNHELLAELLSKRRRWILSYNDCEEIRHLYKDFKSIIPTWKYGMSSDKSSKEILIFSNDL